MNNLRRWDLLWLLLSVAVCLTVLIGLFGHLGDSPPDAYHKWFYGQDESTWKTAKWLGVEIEKSPMDLQVYQELLYETKPDVLIEAGTYKAGSAYFFACIFDLIGHGKVLTIDIVDYPGKPVHPRVTYLTGSSTSEEMVAKVKGLIRPGDKVMVVLDSDHHKSHVLKEIQLYSPLVTVGSYLVVEDTNINGHPVLPKYGAGPWEAVAEFLRSNRDFVADETRERYGFTFNPGGWLKRVKS